MAPIRLIAVGGLVLAGGLMAVELFQPAPMVDAPDALPADLVAEGAGIYAAQCASCHGDNLQGQPNWRVRGDDGLLPAPPHDETGHTWHHDDETLFALTKYGLAGVLEDPPPSGMPAYENVLADDEIIAVLSYIKSTWPSEIQAHQNALNNPEDP